MVNTVAGMTLGSNAYWAALLYTSLCTALFLLRTLTPVLRPEFREGGAPDTDAMRRGGGHPKGGDVKSKNVVLMASALFQIVLVWFLGVSADLSTKHLLVVAPIGSLA